MSLLVCPRAQCSVPAYSSPTSMICRSVSHHHAVCSRMTPSSIESSPQPKTDQLFKKTSGAWKTGRLSGTWHSTRTSAADYCSPDLATMKTTTMSSMDTHWRRSPLQSTLGSPSRATSDGRRTSTTSAPKGTGCLAS